MPRATTPSYPPRALAPLPARAIRRRRRADALESVIWISSAIMVAIFLAERGLDEFGTIGGAATGLGIVAGILGANLLLIQILLASRLPIIDRTIGHDRAVLVHQKLGKTVIWFLLAHATLILIGYGIPEGRDPIAQLVLMFETFPDIPQAILALTIFTIIVILSLVAVRTRLRYEVWHWLHLAVYAAILLAIPHQFSQGRLFAEGSPARWYWIALYVGTGTALLLFRVLIPIWRTLRHDLRVASVTEIASGVTTIEIEGRHLDRLPVHGGQFLVWRFLTPRLAWEPHPFSLSDVPRGNRLRLTIRTLGAGSSRIAKVPVGTRVAIEGPFGIFTEASRVTDGVVFIAAGIGVTPIRSMLEHTAFAPGCGSVILRSPNPDSVYLGEEVAELAREKGATMHTLVGRRLPGSDSWLPAAEVEAGVTLSTLVPHIADSDVYICGPGPWTQLVVADARAAGVPRERIHFERFGW